ncbi:MAG: hypothetical protein UDB11_03075 [Peptococcaceae bacterium]|nr:hypothetical protein [Peptococcaceae bacterium]
MQGKQTALLLCAVILKKGFERCEIVRIVFSDALVVAADKENVIAKFANDFLKNDES